eukprot:jgi/Mesen1/6401/ME000329S05569
MTVLMHVLSGRMPSLCAHFTSALQTTNSPHHLMCQHSQVKSRALLGHQLLRSGTIRSSYESPAGVAKFIQLAKSSIWSLKAQSSQATDEGASSVDDSTADATVLREENKKLGARVAELEEALAAMSEGRTKKDEGEDRAAQASDAELALQGSYANSQSPQASAGAGEEKMPSLESLLASMQWPSPDDPEPFWKRMPLRPLPASTSAPAGGAVERDASPIHVMHITAEMAPLAKVGGLADVVTGLARACLARGNTVDVMLPLYECLDRSQLGDLALLQTFSSFHRGDWVPVQAFRGTIAGIPVLLLDPQNHFFVGSRIYGGGYDELEAYLFFTRACLEYMQVAGMQPDVIHAHEWHTAAVGMLYWDMYHQLSLKKPRLMLTIHNMEHHGECRWEQLQMCGLDGQSYLSVDRAMDDRTVGHNPERLSLLKAGIVYCNAVTYHGVLNGIDTELWDPALDPHLPVPYSADDLRGKAVCKHYLQRALGLEPDTLPGEPGQAKRSPLVVVVTRLVAQKGIHLIRHALHRTRELGGQLVLLGTAPVAGIQAEFEGLAAEFKDSGDIRLLLTYSEGLSHVLFAAGDIILVPSMFEPCGLTQMIGMRYGAVPVVRRTGGLADTVHDVDAPQSDVTPNGFVFDGIDENALNGALDRALAHYHDKHDQWQDLVRSIMKVDNSWNKSAGQYIDLYNSIRVHS